MTQKRQTGISLLDNTKIIYKSVAKTVDAILHLMPTWNNVSHSAVSKASDLLSWANEINSKVATAITKRGMQKRSTIITKALWMLSLPNT